jgi:transposase
MAGNHNDQFELTKNLQAIFADLRRLGIKVAGAVFNMDMGFDTKSARKVCFNHQVKPNMPENRRNRIRSKPGPKRFFDQTRYGNRFCIERTFAWVDKFKRPLIRFERKVVYFKGWHFLAFSLINLRHVLTPKV